MSKYKYKTVSKYIPPTDSDMDEFMDFSKVESGLPSPKSTFLEWKSILSISIITTSLIAFWIIADHANQAMIDPAISIPTFENKKATISNNDTLIEKEKSPIISKKQPNKMTVQKPKRLKKQQTKNQSQAKKPKEKSTKNVVIENLENKFIDAQPIVGFDSLYNYFKETLKYPLPHPADTIEGSVEIQFSVNRKGTIVNPTVIKSMGELFDKEAIRVINNMPLWQPASVNGLPMITRKQIAIQFNTKKQ